MATLNSTTIKNKLYMTYNNDLSITPIQISTYYRPNIMLNTVSNIRYGITGFYIAPTPNDELMLGNTSNTALKIARSGDVSIPGKLTINAKDTVSLEIFPAAANGNYREGIRLHPYDSDSYTGISFCGADNTGSSGTSLESWDFYNHKGVFSISNNNLEAIAMGSTIDIKRNINLSGAINFANCTWNTVGDDAFIGDHNVAGAVCLKGKSGDTGLVFFTPDESQSRFIKFDGKNLHLEGYSDYSSFPTIYGGSVQHSYWLGAFPNNSEGYTQMFGYSFKHENANNGLDSGDIVFSLKPVGSPTTELNIGIDGNYWQRYGQPVVSVKSYSGGVLSLEAGY